MGKQQTHISQISAMQSQLTESNLQVEELQEIKRSLESKVQFPFHAVQSALSYSARLSCLLPHGFLVWRLSPPLDTRTRLPHDAHQT